LKNFGFVDETTVVAPGINGKMSEINAAFGLLQLKHMPYIIERRALIDANYRDGLEGVQGIRCLPQAGQIVANHSYFPILVDDDYPLSRDALYQKLKDQGINGRRYFYPLISEFSMYRGMPSASRENLPIATDASSRVICLPIYPDLQVVEVEQIVNLIGKLGVK
jgi:dTDP-4-amino-4,6-dideoxygalactose transaminase